MRPLLSARIGGVAQKALVIVTRQNGSAPGKWSINWPWGKLELFTDHLEIKMLLNSFNLPLDSIQKIERHLFFQVRVHHTSGDVPQYVSIFGWSLLGKLKAAAKEHRLPLSFG